jgi:hypothetical protein
MEGAGATRTGIVSGFVEAALDRTGLPPELEAALRDPESVPTVGQIASRPGARAQGFRKAPRALLAYEIVRGARGARAGRGFHVPPSRTHETLVAERHCRRLAVCRPLDGGGRVSGA